jgi:hypothetical protein
MEINPRVVFERLFGGGGTLEQRLARMRTDRSLLDFVADDLKHLEGGLPARDRARLDEYLSYIREIERRIERAEKQAHAQPDVPNAPVGVPEAYVEHVALLFDLMALAFQADLTRVITFSMDREASMRTYNNLSISEAFHPLSHHANDPGKQDRLAVIQTYHTKVFARFIDRMVKTPEGDGSLLDHSMVLYGSNMSDSNRHNNDPLPSAILGHAHGRIKGGQHLHYSQDSKHANLLLTLLERTEIPVESIGDSDNTLSEISA